MLIRFSFLLILLQFFVFFSTGQQTGTVEFVDKPFTPEATKRAWLTKKLNTYSLFREASDEEKSFIYWTNHARLFPLSFRDSVLMPFLKLQPKLIGEYSKSLIESLGRVSELPLLAPHSTLTEAAEAHANDLGQKARGLSHNSSNGRTFKDRMIRAGIKHCYAENIAESPNDALVGLLLLYLDIGVPNLGHRINLMNPSYTLVGVGTSRRTNNQLVIVQDFACAQ